MSKIKSSLYSSYYAEACNELRGSSPRLRAWATQLRRNVATVASRWRHCADLTGPGIEPQTSRTDSVRLATELTAGIILLQELRLHKAQWLKTSLLVRKIQGLIPAPVKSDEVSLWLVTTTTVSSKLCCSDAKQRRRAPPPVFRFGVIPLVE